MKPKVSVIIPTYNSERYITNCITSIINQTYKNLEIIIIDDGSVDSTRSKVEDIINKDSRVKIFNQINSGPSVARNNGIQQATGEYIVFVDSDDKVNNLYIEKLVIQMLKDDLDCVCCGYIEESTYGNVNLNHFWCDNEKIDKDQFINFVFNGVGGVLWAKIFKRSIIIENNIRMNPKIFMCEDLIFILEYLKYSNKFGVINDYLYHYNRLNESSISSNININYLENYIEVIYEIEKLLKELKIRQDFIDNIVVSRVQSLVKTILFSETNKYIEVKNKQEFISNISGLFDVKLIKNNISKFENRGFINNIINKLIYKNSYVGLLYISLFSIFTNKIKNKILGR